MIEKLTLGAGKIALSFMGKNFNYEGLGSDLASEVDRAVSHFVHEELSRQGFFDMGGVLLDEERSQLSPDALADIEDIFVIDPIDGSGAAVMGRPDFCVQMAHYRNTPIGCLAKGCGVFRPRTLEMCVYTNEVEYTSYHGVEGLERKQPGHEAAFKGSPMVMLMDYRFFERYTWSESEDVPMIHMNPSGFNMMDVAFNRGFGFVFEYKPWDLCLLPLAAAMGCHAWFLNDDGHAFVPEAIVPDRIDWNWFEYCHESEKFGKIKRPLLIARPERLGAIMASLRPVGRSR